MSDNNFKWNQKKQVQMMTSNRVIQTVALTPKEIITNGGNRIQQDQVIASLCAVVTELMEIQEASAARIDAIYQNRGAKNVSSGVQPVQPEPTE